MKNFPIFFLTLCSVAAQLQAHARPLNPLFERKLPTEAQDIIDIRNGISFLQDQQTLASGHVLRGTHAKGVCATGDLEILDLPSKSPLKVGMFSRPGHFATTLRFANAKGRIMPDSAPDVRAISFAVSMPTMNSNLDGRMDFAMNNAPIFPINDAHIFADILIIAQKGILKGGWAVGLDGLLGLKKTKAIAKVQEQPATAAYQSMTYWSDVPFQLGNTQAVKYRLRPCEANPAEALTDDPDALDIELRRHLHKDSKMSCFDLGVQRLNANRMTDADGRTHSPVEWVENATWLWNDEQAPFSTVARLTLIKDSDFAAAACEAWHIDVTKYTNELHQGLGSLNRARSAGESVSAEKR